MSRRIAGLFCLLTLWALSDAVAVEFFSVDIQGNGNAGFGQSNPALLQNGADAQWNLGNVWNAFNVPAHNLTAAVNPSLALVDTDGAASTANFQIFGNAAGFSNGGGNALYRDYIFAAAGNSSPSFTWQITGLTPGASYDMINFGGVARDGAIGVDRDGNGVVETTKITPVNAGNMLRGITADATGKIIGTMANGTGDAEGNWAGFHLQQSKPTLGLWSVDIQGTGTPTTMSGVEPIYDAGNVWNAFTVDHHAGVSTNPTMSLVDSTGAASPVAFNVNGSVSGFNNAGTLQSDYLFFGAGNVSTVHSIDWSLTGLVPGGTYELMLYGGSIGGREFSMLVDENGDGLLTDELAINVTAAGALVPEIIADATGQIIGQAAKPSGEANWAGFQLRLVAEPAAVPEPASIIVWSLLGTLGVAGVCFRRWRNA